MSIIYKVVRPDMRSAFAPGSFCCQYAIGYRTEAPTMVAPLLAFRRLRDARHFVEIESAFATLVVLRGTTTGRTRRVDMVVAYEDRRPELIRRWWEDKWSAVETRPAPRGTIAIPDFTPLSLVR